MTAHKQELDDMLTSFIKGDMEETNTKFHNFSTKVVADYMNPPVNEVPTDDNTDLESDKKTT